jgi:hypothetical protein
MEQEPSDLIQAEYYHLTPSVVLEVDYKATAGELLVSGLLAALIAVFVAYWISKLIFGRRG